VQHEAAAYACLARHALEAPEVILALTTPDNPLGRPCLVTRKLAGAPLTRLLKRATSRRFAQLLEAAGDYLRRLHAITFEYPGYVMDARGPQTRPLPGAWQHTCWTAEQAQRDALSSLERDRPRLPPALADQLQARFAALADALAAECAPPHFVHGDCHAHQLFLTDRVSGVVDMEVASAGDCGFDLMKFALEMAATFSPDTRWWEPFFAGYGGPPDFELLKLRLLAAGEDNYTCLGPDGWPGARQDILARLLAARDWRALFTT
jgi:aminoglycoside phosphotransferase (APT) family kinase protein